MNETFNLSDWLSKDQDTDLKCNSHRADLADLGCSVSTVVSRIEAAHTDLTGTYADWVNLGFALSDELGEGGRNYFHRISRFYPKYSYTECNKQYDRCLQSKGHGITIGTLFHLAKLAGIDIGRPEDGDGRREEGRRENGNGGKQKEQGDSGLSTSVFGLRSSDSGFLSPVSFLPSLDSVALPTLPASLYASLPEFLQKVVARCATNEERDVMLLGALASISACLPNVSGIYDEIKVYANLFLYITAQASAGKGRLVFCRLLVNLIHRELRKQSEGQQAQYEAELREYNLRKMKDFNAEKPVKPAKRMLFIPANNSATGVFQLLADNEGRGLIFETESDTLANAFKTDYGNYSDGFRKAYHHETISYNRRTENEFVEIDEPRLSTVLSSTPRQVAMLIPTAENGLFSRFIFYHMNLRPEWKNVFPRHQVIDLTSYFDQLGEEFFTLYQTLEKTSGIEFTLSEQQQDQFHDFFTGFHGKYWMLQGDDYVPTIRRLGLIAFRTAMIFTVLRIMETGDLSDTLVCSDTDFQAALSMIQVLVKHSSHVFSELPGEMKPIKPTDKKEQFFDLLPAKFTRQDYFNLASSISIPDRTAERYITVFLEKGLLRKLQHGVYCNLTLTAEEDSA